MTSAEYSRLSALDIRTVDPASVPDIASITVDPALTPEERIRDVARQMNGNPFLYRCNGILVKTTFSGTLPLQTLLEDCLKHAT